MSNLADASLAKAAEALRDARILQRSDRVAGTLSRAYYAIFHTAEALLASLDLEFSSHQAVIWAFGREFAKTGRLDPKFHRYLRLAFDERQIADYDKEV
ncbi:MAG: HEPN domain-containing protein [Armatimonadota bacterium]